MYPEQASLWARPQPLFKDRVDAGRQLARQLSRYADEPNVVVLALPRGGVPVGYEVARALHAPLDVFVVRKLGVPVTAADDWDQPAQRKRVRPALPGSYEHLFHTLGEDQPALARFVINLQDLELVHEELERPRLERAIGVIYRPSTERISHYFEAQLSRQFDAVIHLDETRALEPLERTSAWEKDELPETYPSGI